LPVKAAAVYRASARVGALRTHKHVECSHRTPRVRKAPVERFGVSRDLPIGNLTTVNEGMRVARQPLSRGKGLGESSDPNV
jgi:hypothetical protein